MRFFKFTIYDEASKRESRSAFIAVSAFVVSAVRFLFSDCQIHYQTIQLHFGAMDAGLMAAFLGPCLALYWGRRKTEADNRCNGNGGENA